MSDAVTVQSLPAEELIQLRLVHEIHTSERKSFRACRRRWNWIFRENRYPYLTAKPLELGTVVHLGYEMYYNPDTWTFPHEVKAEYAIKRAVDKCETQRRAFLQQTAVPYLDNEVQADYDERVELIKGMLRYYFYEIAPKHDRHWTPLKVEIGFMVPIPHPDTKAPLWCKCDQCWEKWAKHYPKRAAWNDGMFRINGQWEGLPVVYAGRCDALFEDSEGYYWIADWKTTRTVNVEHDEFLELDDQVIAYVWALRKLGIPIRGFIYHEQKKGFPQPPALNKVRRLGCMYSVAKNQDTDYDTYLKTVTEEDKEAYEAGAYDKFLAYLKEEGPVFFKRWQIYKSDYQCDQAEYNIGQEALEIISPATRVYPSPGRFGCTVCAFRQPCVEQNAGGDYQYALNTLYEQREHYYVRTEASTESKGGE